VVVMGTIIIKIKYQKQIFFFRRVYLATKKNDENKIKYAIKVINKQDIRRKNLIDQSN
jgi:hypothetical protein